MKMFLLADITRSFTWFRIGVSAISSHIGRKCVFMHTEEMYVSAKYSISLPLLIHYTPYYCWRQTMICFGLHKLLVSVFKNNFSFIKFVSIFLINLWHTILSNLHDFRLFVITSWKFLEYIILGHFFQMKKN